MRTMRELLDWCERAPEGAAVTLPAVKLAELLRDRAPAAPVAPQPAVDAPAATWRTMLWTVPADTRIGRVELLEAVGRTPAWLYRHTSAQRTAAGVPRIPHRKIDGLLTFVVGEIREWLREHERIVEAGPTDGDRRRLHALAAELEQ